MFMMAERWHLKKIFGSCASMRESDSVRLCTTVLLLSKTSM
jgi:hypothetical protein